MCVGGFSSERKKIKDKEKWRENFSDEFNKY
jgi:hypothetical protein